MKVYNTLSEALSLAQAENGGWESWSGPGVVGATSGDYYTDRTESTKANFLSHLKIEKTCESASDCGISDDIKVYSLNDPEDNGSPYNEIFSYDEDEDGEGLMAFILSDGAFVVLGYNDRTTTIDFSIDTNGPNKGPNTVGRDFFFFNTKTKNGLKTIVPAGGSFHSTFNFAEFESDGRFCCTTNYTCDGYYCSARLLMEDKMDY